MSFGLSSKLNGYASVDRRIVEGAIRRRIIESRINKSRVQNIQKDIAGRSTASQLKYSPIGCSPIGRAPIGTRDLHIILTFLLHSLAWHLLQYMRCDR